MHVTGARGVRTSRPRPAPPRLAPLRRRPAAGGAASAPPDLPRSVQAVARTTHELASSQAALSWTAMNPPPRRSPLHQNGSWAAAPAAAAGRTTDVARPYAAPSSLLPPPAFASQRLRVGGVHAGGGSPKCTRSSLQLYEYDAYRVATRGGRDPSIFINFSFLSMLFIPVRDSLHKRSRIAGAESALRARCQLRALIRATRIIASMIVRSPPTHPRDPIAKCPPLTSADANRTLAFRRQHMICTNPICRPSRALVSELETRAHHTCTIHSHTRLRGVPEGRSTK